MAGMRAASADPVSTGGVVCGLDDASALPAGGTGAAADGLLAPAAGRPSRPGMSSPRRLASGWAWPCCSGGSSSTTGAAVSPARDWMTAAGGLPAPLQAGNAAAEAVGLASAAATGGPAGWKRRLHVNVPRKHNVSCDAQLSAPTGPSWVEASALSLATSLSTANFFNYNSGQSRDRCAAALL